MLIGKYPRDKDQLILELDAAMRLRDVNRIMQLKDRLAPRWWEGMAVVMLFISALGLLASLFQYVDLRDEPLNTWMLFWFGLMILTSVFCFQFIIFKLYNLRRANDVLTRMVSDIHSRLEKIAEAAERIPEQGGAIRTESEPSKPSD